MRERGRGGDEGEGEMRERGRGGEGEVRNFEL